MKKNTKSWSFRQIWVIVLVIALLAPAQAGAGWHSEADKLPGLVSGKNIAIGAGIAAAGIVTFVFIIKKRNKKKRQQENNSSAGLADRRAASPQATPLLTPVQEAK